MTLSATEVSNLKKASTLDGVLPAIQNRWSPRSFSGRDVAPADLARVFEAARWAASSYNEQPWRFLVGARNSSTYKKIFGSLIPFNQGWAASAPATPPVLVMSKSTLTREIASDAIERAGGLTVRFSYLNDV